MAANHHRTNAWQNNLFISLAKYTPLVHTRFRDENSSQHTGLQVP
jgi:hypothetical protein